MIIKYVVEKGIDWVAQFDCALREHDLVAMKQIYPKLSPELQGFATLAIFEEDLKLRRNNLEAKKVSADVKAQQQKAKFAKLFK